MQRGFDLGQLLPFEGDSGTINIPLGSATHQINHRCVDDTLASQPRQKARLFGRKQLVELCCLGRCVCCVAHHYDSDGSSNGLVSRIPMIRRRVTAYLAVMRLAVVSIRHKNHRSLVQRPNDNIDTMGLPRVPSRQKEDLCPLIMHEW